MCVYVRSIRYFVVILPIFLMGLIYVCGYANCVQKLHMGWIAFEVQRKMMETNVRHFRVLAFVFLPNGLSLINILYMLKLLLILFQFTFQCVCPVMILQGHYWCISVMDSYVLVLFVPSSDSRLQYSITAVFGSMNIRPVSIGCSRLCCWFLAFRFRVVP